MGAVCQIALDIPPEIVDGLAAGIMTRSGSVVRNSAGQIVAHLKETELGSDRVADKMAKAAAAAWRTTHGKVGRCQWVVAMSSLNASVGVR